MASKIDPSVIADDRKVDKSDLREQLTIAKNEITALQEIINIPVQMAFDDNAFDTI